MVVMMNIKFELCETDAFFMFNLKRKKNAAAVGGNCIHCSHVPNPIQFWCVAIDWSLYKAQQ